MALGCNEENFITCFDDGILVDVDKFVLTRKQHYTYNPPDTPPKIIYVDEDILVADKPSGLLTVPGKHSDDSLTLRLREMYPGVNPVHRLDTSTSGIILFSRNKSANAVLSEQFRNRIPRKKYVAVCEGVIKENSGALAYPMSRDWTQAALTSAPIHRVLREVRRLRLIKTVSP